VYPTGCMATLDMAETEQCRRPVTFEPPLGPGEPGYTISFMHNEPFGGRTSMSRADPHGPVMAKEVPPRLISEVTAYKYLQIAKGLTTSRNINNEQSQRLVATTSRNLNQIEKQENQDNPHPNLNPHPNYNPNPNQRGAGAAPRTPGELTAWR
jgi:hypothetical protein